MYINIITYVVQLLEKENFDQSKEQLSYSVSQRLQFVDILLSFGVSCCHQAFSWKTQVLV